jgi:hypothetical protein
VEVLDGAFDPTNMTGDALTVAANVLLALAALGCLTFTATYTVKAAWRTTAIGRHMFYFGWAVFGAYSVAVARGVWPDQEWLDYVRLLALSTVVFVFWQRVYLLYRSLHPDHPDHEESA